MKGHLVEARPGAVTRSNEDRIIGLIFIATVFAESIGCGRTRPHNFVALLAPSPGRARGVF